MSRRVGGGTQAVADGRLRGTAKNPGEQEHLPRGASDRPGPRFQVCLPETLVFLAKLSGRVARFFLAHSGQSLIHAADASL
jgi:hypothetical protein